MSSDDAMLARASRAEDLAGNMDGYGIDDTHGGDTSQHAREQMAAEARELSGLVTQMRLDMEALVQERDEALYLVQREHDAAIPERTQRALSEMRDRIERLEATYRAHLAGDAHRRPGA
jgi:hypothetical protein